MAQFTINNAGNPQANRLLETVLITNQAGGASVAVSQAVPVPPWATSSLWLIDLISMTGTTPLLDFVLKGCDPYTLTTTNTWPLGDWDGITQMTTNTTANVIQAIEVGPSFSADDTGSATASSRYAVNAMMPPFIVYTYTTDGTTADEDYSFSINVHFK